MAVLPRIEVGVGKIIFLTCPNDGAAESHSKPRLEIHATTMMGKIRDNKLGEPNFRENLVADLFIVVHAVNANRFKTTIFDRRVDAELVGIVQRRLKRRGYKAAARDASSDRGSEVFPPL